MDREKNNLIIVVLLMLLIDAFSVFFLGTYLESYERFFSGIVSGQYSFPAIKDWNSDVQFLLISLYSYINQFFPQIQIYGVVLFLFTLSGLMILGLIVYDSLNISNRNVRLWVFLLLYLLLTVDNLVHLSSNRVTFIFMVISLYRFDRWIFYKQRQNWKIILLNTFLFLIACLMRLEVAVICSLVYFITILILRQEIRYSFVPLILTFIFFTSYNFMMSSFATEARQVALYKELQFIDRNDILYDSLTDIQLLEVEAFKCYNLMDSIHFKMSFYDDISTKSGGLDDLILFRGIRFDSAVNTIVVSFWNMKKVWYLMGAFFITVIILIICRRNKFRYLFYTLFVSLFPLILCMYTLVPLRFVVPFYLTFITLNVILLSRDTFNKAVGGGILLLVIVNLFQLKYELGNKKYYDSLDSYYTENINKIESVNAKYGGNLFVCNLDMDRYFPIKPFLVTENRNTYFVNFYFFAALYAYKDLWEKKFNTNPHSLKDKLDYIVKTNAVMLVSADNLEFMCKYLNIMYGVKLKHTFLEYHDKELKYCRLHY